MHGKEMLTEDHGKAQVEQRGQKLGQQWVGYLSSGLREISDLVQANASQLEPRQREEAAEAFVQAQLTF